MSFAIQKHEAVPQGIRRIITERIDAALEELEKRRGVLPDEAVHEARKQFKQIRGALRLVRGELGEKRFGDENRAYRDAGRPLSALRDAKALIDTLDALTRRLAGSRSPAPPRPLRKLLLAKRREARRQVLQVDHAAAKVTASLKAARRRVNQWPARHPGWKALAGGLKRVYRAAQKALRRARRRGDDESLHELRKRAKDLRYDLELLAKTWPPLLEPLAEEAHRLTTLLGEDHDLGVLRRVVREQGRAVCAAPQRQWLQGVIRQRRKALQKEAMELARKLLAEDAADFARRLKGYWKTWHAGPAPQQATSSV
jgi:CHAD domain-containing protein